MNEVLTHGRGSAPGALEVEMTGIPHIVARCSAAPREGEAAPGIPSEQRTIG